MFLWRSCNISVFYSSKDWYDLVFLAIKPFLKTLKEEGRKVDFLLYCSNKRGEHLRLVIETDYLQREPLLKELDEYLKNYLQQFPSAIEPVRLPIKQFYLNFPNNSVQYLYWEDVNSYSPFLNIDDGLFKIIFGHLSATTEVVLEIAAEDQAFFIESRMLLAIQLHLFLLKSLNFTLSETQAFFTAIFENIFSPAHYDAAYDEAIPLLEKDFRQYEAELVSFFAPVWHSSDQKFSEEEWVTKWENICVNTQNKLEHHFQGKSIKEEPDKFHDFYKFLFTETNQMLGVESEIHLYYFITQILNRTTGTLNKGLMEEPAKVDYV